MKNPIEIIAENSLTVRCLPHVVVSHWSYREGQKLKDGETLVVRPDLGGRTFVRTEKTVEHGGWWYVKETKNTGATVQFNRKYDKFFAPTLEEALQLYIDSKGQKQ